MRRKLASVMVTVSKKIIKNVNNPGVIFLTGATPEIDDIFQLTKS